MQEQVLQKVKQYIAETEMIKPGMHCDSGSFRRTGFNGNAGYPSENSGRI